MEKNSLNYPSVRRWKGPLVIYTPRQIQGSELWSLKLNREMGTREVYEEKLRRGNLDHDPTINPGLGNPRCPRCLSLLAPEYVRLPLSACSSGVCYIACYRFNLFKYFNICRKMGSGISPLFYMTPLLWYLSVFLFDVLYILLSETYLLFINGICACWLYVHLIAFQWFLICWHVLFNPSKMRVDHVLVLMLLTKH